MGEKLAPIARIALKIGAYLNAPRVSEVSHFVSVVPLWFFPTTHPTRLGETLRVRRAVVVLFYHDDTKSTTTSASVSADESSGVSTSRV